MAAFYSLCTEIKSLYLPLRLAFWGFFVSRLKDLRTEFQPPFVILWYFPVKGMILSLCGAGFELTICLSAGSSCFITEMTFSVIISDQFQAHYVISARAG